MQVMDDMRSAGIDFITIGQYLQPTRRHGPVDRFVTPQEFKSYESIARAKGFLMVSKSQSNRLEWIHEGNALGGSDWPSDEKRCATPFQPDNIPALFSLGRRLLT